jgi:hypothetical protein
MDDLTQALNDLVSELTKHADAMSGLLMEVVEGRELEPGVAQRAVSDYLNFIKEA